MGKQGEPAPEISRRRWRTEPLDLAGNRDTDLLLAQAYKLSGLTVRVIDYETGRVHCGPNYSQVFGFPPPDSASRFTEHVHPEDLDSFIAWRDFTLSTVGCSTRIFRIVTPAGQTRWIDSHTQTLAGPTGRPARILITSRDITRYRYLDLELTVTTDRLQRVHEAAQVGTWETDFATGEENWSPEAWALIEPGGKGEASVERWLAAVHPDDRERVWRETEEAIETGHYLSDFRVVHPDGSDHWLRAAGKVQRNATGQASHLHGAVVDITERKQTEEAFSRLAMIIEATPDFVSWADLEGHAVYVNPAGRRMCGYEPGDSIAGKSVLDFVAPHHHALMGGEIKSVTERDGIWTGELDMIDRNGRVFPVSKVSILHKDPAGRPLYMSTVSRDISKEKQSEEALREADRRKDQFLATLAHELRNPLAPLQTVADAMQHLDADDSRLSTVRKTIRQQTAYLTRLVDDLLDVSRLASGKLELTRATIDIQDSIRQAAEMCSRDVAARGHTLVMALPEAPLKADADGFRLTQVMVNLIGNAVKYSNDGANIEVTAHRDGDEAVLAVADNGMGIDAGFLPKVFDAFAQATQQRQRAAGGLGLGLMLVKQIVELHGGTVTARSAGLGSGSRFEVRLPLALCTGTSDATMGEPPNSPEPAPLKGMRVMVVDDYPAIRDAMELMLSMKGLVVETAAGGSAALLRLQAFAPEAVLLDLRMPGMSGIELAANIRSTPALAGLRLIAMSGDGLGENRSEMLTAGFDAHLIKPVQTADLLALLSELRSRDRHA